MKLDDDRKTAAVDLTRCLGCGLCVDVCPEAAIELHNKIAETVPPPTLEDMMEVITRHVQSAFFEPSSL
jgi:Na+-translocating ferredoxin:NAD+ oxidoreductase subunit B